MIHLQQLEEFTKLAKQYNAALIAVSKTKPVEAVMEAYGAGQRIFGENKVQELVQKYEACPKDIAWHLIGHLQTNKVKYIAPFIDTIQSVDSYNLAIEINKYAEKYNRIINVLLEVHIAAETNKYGFSEEEIIDLLDINAFAGLKNIRLVGLMGMATFTPNPVLIKQEFAGLKHLFDKIKQKYFPQQPDFKEVSMGMSGDYKIALEEGSTAIRIGSAIFGERSYAKKI